MRITVHDFAGHPFQVQLSRELAARGHYVQHVYLDGLPGPKGMLVRLPGDPRGFQCIPISLSRPFAKYSIVKRYFAHKEYVSALLERVISHDSDVVLSANAPIDVQSSLVSGCGEAKVAVVHWMQDVYYLALRELLRRRLGRIGEWLALPYLDKERRVCEQSAAVVCIADEFKSFIQRQQIRPRKTHLVENWAPLDELPPAPKSNPWSAKRGIDRKLVFLYAGTLGMKHTPEMLVTLASDLRDGEEAAVVVVSEGPGRMYLHAEALRGGLDNLLLFDFQPYADMPEVLSAADVLVAMIAPEAGRFSVPSKVLSYMAVGRPVLLAAPVDNLAARIVAAAGAGLVVDSRDVRGFVQAAHRLAHDPGLRRHLGARARSYALRTFDIRPIAARFEAIIEDALEASCTRVAMSGEMAPVERVSRSQ